MDQYVLLEFLLDAPIPVPIPRPCAVTCTRCNELHIYKKSTFMAPYFFLLLEHTREEETLVLLCYIRQ